MPTPTARLLTVRELAEHLHVGESTIRRWAHFGQIPYFKAPGKASVLRFDLEAVQAALAANPPAEAEHA